jgi:hypothetical protein
MVITLTTDDSPNGPVKVPRIDSSTQHTPGPSSRTERLFGDSFARRIRHRNDQGHDSRTSFHITPEDRQAPPRHLQARALAKGGPEPSSSVLHHLI